MSRIGWEQKPNGLTVKSGQQGEVKTAGKLRKWFPYVSEFYLSQDLTASIREMLCALGRVREEERGYQMCQSASFFFLFLFLLRQTFSV